MKPEKIDWPLDAMRRYPIHEDYLHKGQEIVLIYEFKPSKGCDIAKYIEYLKRHFKRKYNAYSVTVGRMEEQLKSK